MTDRAIKLELMDKLEQIAKEIAKGNDVYITKSASGVVIKKMTVGKVWEYGKKFICFRNTKRLSALRNEKSIAY